jgi:hypothetical protein
VPGRDDDDELVAAQHDGLEAVQGVEPLHEADVDGPLGEQAQDAGGVHDLDRDVGVGVDRPEGGQQARQQELAGGVAGGQRQRAALRLLEPADHLGGAVEGRERGLGLRVERSARLGRAHAEPAALEQRHAEPGLERVDALRDRRLRQVQRVGRAVQAGRLDRGHEGGQLPSRERVREREPHAVHSGRAARSIPVRNRSGPNATRGAPGEPSR